MLNAIQKGILTDSTKWRLDELEKQKEELSLNITVAELQKPKLTREYMECWFSQFQCGNQESNEYRKRLIDTFVNSVYVYDDKLVLTYNYQQGMQTISLAEIEAFLGSDLTAVSPPQNTDFFLKSRCFSYFYMVILRGVFDDRRNLGGTEKMTANTSRVRKNRCSLFRPCVIPVRKGDLKACKVFGSVMGERTWIGKHTTNGFTIGQKAHKSVGFRA